MFRRIIGVLCIILFLLTCIGLVGCQEVISYKTELFIYASLGSGQREDIAFAGNLGLGGISQYLNEDSPSLDIVLGVYPFQRFLYRAQLLIVKYVGAEKIGVVERTSVYGFESKNNFYNLPYGIEIDYNVEDSTGTHPCGFGVDDVSINSLDVVEGYRLLANRSGTHHLCYKVPSIEKYNTKSIEYDVKFEILEDERQGIPKIDILQDSNDFKLIKTDRGNPSNSYNSYDLHIVSSGAPLFRLYDSISNETIAISTASGFSNSFCVIYREIGKFNWDTQGDYPPDKLRSGVYVCEVTFLGNDNYPICKYICYIVSITESK